MDNNLGKDWKNLKEELKGNLDKTIERGIADIETLDLMIKILENSKLKVTKKDNQGGV